MKSRGIVYWRKTKVFVVWDSPLGSEIRQSLYADYKANRIPQTQEEKDKKSEFYKQVELTKRELYNLRIYQVEKSNVEADDIIATIVWNAEERALQTLIISEDKDFQQLISHKTHLYSVSKKFVLDMRGFQQKTGICFPHNFTDYLALVGDTADNWQFDKCLNKPLAIWISQIILPNSNSP